MAAPDDQQIAATIRRFTAENGFPPTVRELAVLWGDHPGTVHRWLLRAREAGVVDWVGGTARTLRVVDTTETTCGRCGADWHHLEHCPMR